MSPGKTQRRTLAAAAHIEGLGLFTGCHGACTIAPARVGNGLTLTRTPGEPPLEATIEALSAEPVHPAFARIPPRHTALQASGAPPFYTTEHLLGALAGLGITDALIQLEGPEFPIADGSAAPFIEACLAAGITDLPETIDPIVVRGRLRVESPDGLAFITAEPTDLPSLRYELDYGLGAPIHAQAAEWSGSSDRFVRDIAPARTFSLAAEASQMRALGLFGSFTPQDLPVIDDTGGLIENEWRFPDEPARHKLLDLIGDLALTGRPVAGRITAVRAGHALNHAMARALAAHEG